MCLAARAPRLRGPVTSTLGPTAASRNALDPTPMLDETWTNSEKRVARLAFEAARVAELNALLLQFKQRAAQAREIDEVWEIRDWLNTEQRQFERNYDFRYSQLIRVFGHLLARRRIEINALQGLSDEKIAAIKYIAEMSSP